MIKRRETRTVVVGDVKIGSGHPVSVQSMTKTDTGDIEATAGQIRELEDAGCEIVRIAVKDQDAARAVASIKKEISIPLVADIHFDYRLALEAVKSGADKIRINPGNISNTDELNKIIDAVSSAGIPVRIGVNSGSLRENIVSSGDVDEVMTDSALKCIEHFRKRGFHDLVVSLKGADVPATVRAYRKLAMECDYPLHLGITAAGSPEKGIVKSSIGIGALLLDGIGDTIRVSLTGDPVTEVNTARNILAAVGARNFGPQVIACPTCGRCQVDLISIVEELEDELRRDTRYAIRNTDKQLIIAIMGCEVNGPGEAKNADIGIAFGKDRGAIFSRGKVVKTVEEGEAIKELLEMIKKEI
ncbi:MAG: flavodoxin-dependent (E)-4-hydroxy-3-methylbut-2-enyl-diphosphate synthase [Candidatus Omnitrophota bacterium]|nr:flavodoxin-dependent (E)-4-hydroxy-3-methylbut-2-enyl-diphosphate synthase [Candidatus Omnitrophota bacterium]